MQVRNALFMPTDAAKTHIPTIERFYDRLVDNGKLKLVAITAAMRKFLTIVNVIRKTEQPWNPQTQSASLPRQSLPHSLPACPMRKSDTREEALAA